MILYRNNDVKQAYEADVDVILTGFAQSEVYQDKTRDEKIRLALFIAFDEPNGLQSSFLGHQFNKLWDFWCENKFKFIGAH